MKVRTLKDNVGKYRRQKGEVVEVDQGTAEHWFKLGVAEEVKAPAPAKKPAPKKPVKKDGE